jgi:uncharacterized iron-regulated membrane protein
MTKAIWAAIGLVPPVMFVTGAVMWWNRVIRPAARRSADTRAGDLGRELEEQATRR